jgi:hypothetical protein
MVYPLAYKGKKKNRVSARIFFSSLIGWKPYSYLKYYTKTETNAIPFGSLASKSKVYQGQTFIFS